MLHNIPKTNVLGFACAFSYVDTQQLEQGVQVCIFHLIFLKRGFHLSEKSTFYVTVQKIITHIRNNNKEFEDLSIQYLWN